MVIDRGMDKEEVRYIYIYIYSILYMYKMEYYSAIKRMK